VANTILIRGCVLEGVPRCWGKVRATRSTFCWPSNCLFSVFLTFSTFGISFWL